MAAHIPTFDSHLKELNQFIFDLAKEYRAGKLKTWDSLEERVNIFFTPAQMEVVESVVRGWHRMSSYSDGATRTHVIGAFLGLVVLPEFQNLALEQQELVKWMVLFHDVEKEIRDGQRDPAHGFRSAVTAARQLPRLGFPITVEYDDLIGSWSKFTCSAVKASTSRLELIQDNDKLPEILAGIDRMFGADAPTGLIVKGVLLHMSIDVLRDWRQTAPLTDKEIKRYVTDGLMPLLKVLMLADNDGWVLFYPQRERQRNESLETFQRIMGMIPNDL